MPHLRILSDDDVRATIDSQAALNLARTVLRDQAAGATALSSPTSMGLDARPLGGPLFKFKAASVGHLRASGIRLIGRAKTDTAAPNYCAVFDHEAGGLAGLVPDYVLSRIRTAAFGAAVAERLANPGPVTVALFGAGNIAREIAPMLLSALPVRELRVHARRLESAEALAAGLPDAPVRAEPDRAAALRGAGLVITLTESPTPLVLAGELEPGAALCTMGSHNEVEYAVLAAADRLVVDDVEYACEAGDGGAWIKQGHLTREAFAARVDALACEVVAGTRPGRAAAGDRVVAVLQGMAIGDIAFAAHAFRQAQATGRGSVVQLP